MSPELRVRITGKNDSGPTFAEPVRDAKIAAAAIEASGRQAASGLMAQNAAMRAMGDSTKMAANQQRNLVFQLNDVAVSLAGGANPLMVFAQQGSQIATIYGPEEGGLGKALSETGKMATSMITKFWPIAAVVGLGTAAIGGMTHEINKASKVQVSFGDVAMASWQVFADGVYGLVQPAIAQIGTWMGQLWEWAAPGLKTVGNGIVATFLGAFDAAKIAWGAFPGVMGDMAYTTANNVIGGIETMINGSISLLNGFIGTVNEVSGLDLGKVGSVDFSGVDNPYTGAMTGVAKDVAGAFSGAFQNDYLGSAFDAIKDRAIALANATDKASSSAKAANDNFKSLANGGVREMAKETNSFADAARSAFGNMGTGLIEAFRKGGDVGGNVLDMLVGKVGALGESLMNKGLNGLLDIGLNALFGAMGGGGGLGRLGSFSIGSLPMYANGTDNHPGGLAIVGERGPEIVNLPRGSSVTPNGGGGPVMNFYITGSRQDAAEIASIARQQAMDVVRAYQANPYRKAS